MITTAPELTRQFETARANLQNDLAIPIHVITREEFVDMVLTHLGDLSSETRDE